MIKKYLTLLLFLPIISLHAQEFEYQLKYEGIGDNREFFSNIAMSQTILGSRGAFETGLKIDNHRIRVGMSKLFEFGSEMNFQPNKLIMYYQFKNEKREFLMGSFPRRGRINFPLAMLTDTLLYYRPNIEGLFTETHWDWGKQNIFVDWTSRQTDTIRENFEVGFSGEIFYKIFFLQNYYLMYHDAGPAIDIPGDHIKDYMGYSVMAGMRTPEDFPVEASIKAGVLSSYFRIRSVTDGYINGTSLYAELFAKYKNFGIKSTLHSGDAQNFKDGDRFYHAKNYLRTNLIWYFINHDNIHAKFTWSLHYLNWDDLDNQQQISLIYVFDGAKPLKKQEY